MPSVIAVAGTEATTKPSSVKENKTRQNKAKQNKTERNKAKNNSNQKLKHEKIWRPSDMGILRLVVFEPFSPQ